MAGRSVLVITGSRPIARARCADMTPGSAQPARRGPTPGRQAHGTSGGGPAQPGRARHPSERQSAGTWPACARAFCALCCLG